MWFLVDVTSSVLGLLGKAIGPLIGLLAGWFWGQWRASKDWKKKEFHDVSVLGLNMVSLGEQPSLRLRTLFERPITALFPNPIMQQRLKQAIKEAKPGEPLLRFSKEDAWFILNTILNQIAEKFAEGSLRADMGGKVVQRWYTFCLTFEHEENMHQYKTRIQLIERDKLKSFPLEGKFLLETPKHAVRVQTLRHMRQEYEKNPHLFMDIELTL